MDTTFRDRGGYRKLLNERSERLICDGDNPLIYDYYNKYFRGGVMGCLTSHPQDGHSGTFLVFSYTAQ